MRAHHLLHLTVSAFLVTALNAGVMADTGQPTTNAQRDAAAASCQSYTSMAERYLSDGLEESIVNSRTTNDQASRELRGTVVDDTVNRLREQGPYEELGDRELESFLDKLYQDALERSERGFSVDYQSYFNKCLEYVESTMPSSQNSDQIRSMENDQSQNGSSSDRAGQGGGQSRNNGSGQTNPELNRR